MARKLTLAQTLISGGLLVVALFLVVGVSHVKDLSPVQIPRIVQLLDFGISAESDLYPARIAVDSTCQRVYLFNDGDNWSDLSDNVPDARIWSSDLFFDELDAL